MRERQNNRHYFQITNKLVLNLIHGLQLTLFIVFRKVSYLFMSLVQVLINLPSVLFPPQAL